jgi:cysteine desulfurase
MKTRIYLDHAATTPLSDAAREAMAPWLDADGWGNPSGQYALGRKAARALDDARRRIAHVLGAKPQEIVFTGPGTESINAAVKGVALAQQRAGLGNHLVTTSIEHHAVLHSCEWLEQFGFETTVVGTDAYGGVDPAALAAAITDRTVLVSVMLANNEIGTVQPLAEISRAVSARATELDLRIALHTDAVQGANSLDLDVSALGVDLLSLSAHKFGGPKGAGVLYIRRGTPYQPLLSGGGQERQRRAGTENVASAAATAAALETAQANRKEYARHCRELTTRLVSGITDSIPDAKLTGHPEARLPNNAHFTFEGAESDAILAALDEEGIAASAGSACNSETWEPSHVLSAIGVPLRRAFGALRLTVGPGNTQSEIDLVLGVLPRIVADSRANPRRL